MTDEERDWPDPDPSSGLEPRRLRIRLGVAFGVCLGLLVVSRPFLAQALPLLWPPTDPLAQWVSLVLLHLCGYLLVPLMVGSFVADILLERLE